MREQPTAHDSGHAADEPATAHPTGESDYFTAHEHKRLEHWRVVVADMPPMTQDEIDRVAEVFRQIDAERAATP